MTRDSKYGCRSALATGDSETVRHGAHLLAQAKDAAQKIYISCLRHLHAWWRYETTVRELSQLCDRELADLGITRWDIPRVASESQDPEDRAKYRVR
jgi:uncharacterized protein YjiS (DUF1127 family)